MKKVIQMTGGTIIAAAAVILVIQVYTGGGIFTSLGEAAKTETRTEQHTKENFEKAVLSDPVLAYCGEGTKETGKTYPLWEELKVSDFLDGYDKSLALAVSERRIQVQEAKIYDTSGNETADAFVDMDNGILQINKSGTYRIQIKGVDSHNNRVGDTFCIAVNRKGEEE